MCRVYRALVLATHHRWVHRIECCVVMSLTTTRTCWDDNTPVAVAHCPRAVTQPIRIIQSFQRVTSLAAAVVRVTTLTNRCYPRFTCLVTVTSCRLLHVRLSMNGPILATIGDRVNGSTHLVNWPPSAILLFQWSPRSTSTVSRVWRLTISHQTILTARLLPSPIRNTSNRQSLCSLTSTAAAAATVILRQTPLPRRWHTIGTKQWITTLECIHAHTVDTFPCVFFFSF